MIIKANDEEEIETLGDETDSIKGGIRSDDMGFALTMLSASFYGNPIGSIVREVTSNCWDSHREAEVDTPILVSIEKDYENIGEYTISFQDKGVGLSVERFNNIYVNWFSSTKRGTNNQKGGFGLGCKSPFSYSENFFINTIHDGYERAYVAYKANNEFKFDLLFSKISDEHNGTTIKFNIKNDVDRWKFVKEMKHQLCYFSNVICKSPYDVFDNDYAIFEFENFKVRSNTPYTEMHILLGEAVYPIDWKQLEMEAHVIKVPVALSFNIGELQVTPNRESLQYSKEIVAKIKDKISATLEELKKAFSTQNPEYNELFEFLSKRKQEALLTLKDGNRTVALNLSSIGCQTKVIFSPLKELEYFPGNPFFMFRAYTIRKGKADDGASAYFSSEYDNPRDFYFADYLVPHSNKMIGEGTVWTLRKYDFREYAAALQLQRNQANRNIKDFEVRLSRGKAGELGIAMKIYKFKKLVIQAVKDNFRRYRILSEAEMREVRREAAEKAREAKLLRQINGTCFIIEPTQPRVEIKLQTLLTYKKLFYYVKDDTIKYKADILRDFITNNFTSKKLRKETFGKGGVKNSQWLANNWRPFRIIEVNETNYKLIKKLPNLVHINKFFETKEFYPLFNKVVTSYLLSKFVNKYEYLQLRYYSEYYYDKFEYVKEHVAKYYSRNNMKFVDYYSEQIMNIPLRNHKSTNQVRAYKKELVDILDKFEFTQYIYSHSIPAHIKLTIVKAFLKGVKHLNQSIYDYVIKTTRAEHDSDNRGQSIQQESTGTGSEGSNEELVQRVEGSEETEQSQNREINQDVREEQREGDQERGEDSRDEESSIEETSQREEEIDYSLIFL